MRTIIRSGLALTLSAATIAFVGCAAEDQNEGNRTAPGVAGAGTAAAPHSAGGSSSQPNSMSKGGAMSASGSSSSTASLASAGRGSSVGGATSAGGNSSGIAGNSSAVAGSSSAYCAGASSPDVPDSDGRDTNCDGIDGNAAQSVFVSPNGLDSSAGTKDDPVRTIAKGILLAQASKGRLTDVLVCVGSYAENLIVKDSPVGLHGGYDCHSWARSLVKSQVVPTAGVPLRIEKVTQPMAVTRLAIQAPDAKTAGQSSQAVQVVSSKGIHFEQSLIAAGRGASGTAGKAQTALHDAPKQAKAASGEAAVADDDGSIGCQAQAETVDVDFNGKVDNGPDLDETRCKVPRSGGDGPSRSCPTSDPNVHYDIVGGKGGSGAVKPYKLAPNTGVTGGVGIPSRVLHGPVVGTFGKAFGSLSADGYVTSNAGGDGEDGLPGASGNGGLGGNSCLVRSSTIDTGDKPVATMTGTYAGYTCVAATLWGLDPWMDQSNYNQGRTVTMFPGSGGGQGGYGGCGGFKGYGGGAGGASIALLSFESEVSLVWTDIVASDGGDGGAPSKGTVGQLGGEGGDGGVVTSSIAPLPTVNGEPLFAQALIQGSVGAPGGKGQDGTSGGPGGGGASIGILWQGSVAPSTDATVTLHSGNGGKGGTSAEAQGDPGAAGLSADRYNPTQPNESNSSNATQP